MIQLPRHLSPWRHFLDILDDELASALIPMLQRITAVVGTSRSSSPQEIGQPDGFDGLSRRGPYDRLLISEWLFAEEAPLEFARRATVGEHAFLRLAYTTPHTTFRSAAIIDAGPGQLGTPRIAHLAALIVLAQRAETERGTFSWCIAQQPDRIYPIVNVSTLSSLLQGRSDSEATEEQIATASHHLSDSTEIEDLWLIGGSRFAQLEAARQRRNLVVDDILEPDVRRLRVTVGGGSRHRGREIELDLPSDSICTRLLRDPFKREQAPDPAPYRQLGPIRPISNLIHVGSRGLAAIGPNVHTLLYVSLPQPNSNSEKGFGVYCQRDERLMLAATRISRKLLGAWWDSRRNGIVTGRLNGSQQHEIDGCYLPDFQIDTEALRASLHLGPLWKSFSPPNERAWHLLLGDGRLIRLLQGTPDGRATVVDSGIHHLHTYHGCTHYIAEGESGHLRYVCMLEDGDVQVSQLAHRTDDQLNIAHSSEGRTAVVGHIPPDRRGQQGLVAMELNDDMWEIRHGTDHWRIPVNAGKVHGVMLSPAAVPEQTETRFPALVVQVERRRLRLIRTVAPTIIDLPTAPEDINHVAIDEINQLISYSTAWGGVVVYSLNKMSIIYGHRPRFPKRNP